MKFKIIVFICILFNLLGLSLHSDSKVESYFWESISTPDKTLNFSVMILPQRYKWIESKTAGNYSTITLSVKNKNKNKILEWKNYNIYLLLKNNDLIHNYKTIAKKGSYANNYKIEPNKIRYQTLCFGKKFNPDNIKIVYLKMTDSNFIQIRYFKRENKGKATNTIAKTTQKDTKLNPEAKKLLLKFLKPGADYTNLTKSLRPTEADYKAYFANNSWQDAMKKYNELWDKYPITIKPREGQTKLLLWAATVEDIKYGTGDSSQFPGGYKMIIDRIETGHVIYKFKFVKPDKTTGMSFDGLVKVNGKWVIFPKPWRIFQKK